MSILREAAIQALLLALRLMIPVTAGGAVACLITIYAVLCATGFYAVARLVNAALNIFFNPA